MEAQARLAESFHAMSADALRTNNQTFLNMAFEAFQKRDRALDAAIQPIRESLDQVGAQVRELEFAREQEFSGLSQQLKALTSALRPAAGRGQWTELSLRRTVELAGVAEICEYSSDPDGPDLVVHLPGGRHVPVDAKTSVSACLEAAEAPSDEARLAKAREFSEAVRARVDELASAEYASQFCDAPELVVCFLPGDAFLAAALDQDPSLVECGATHRVLLATPTTLIGLLKAVAFGWRQENLARQAREVSELGKSLHSRLSLMLEHLAATGEHLERSVASYNKAAQAMESQVLPEARKFQSMGVASGNGIPVPAAIQTLARRLEERSSSTIATS
jgi:DNA recombination protein RmuC